MIYENLKTFAHDNVLGGDCCKKALTVVYKIRIFVLIVYMFVVIV